MCCSGTARRRARPSRRNAGRPPSRFAEAANGDGPDADDDDEDESDEDEDDHMSLNDSEGKPVLQLPSNDPCSMHQTWNCRSSIKCHTIYSCNADADPLFATSEDEAEPDVEGEGPEDEHEEAPRQSAAHRMDALSIRPQLSMLLRHKVPLLSLPMNF